MATSKQIPAIQRAPGASGAANGKGTAPGTALAPRASTAVALPADMQAELAAYAKEDSAAERPSLSKISFRGGMMTYMQSPVPGDNMDMILIATAMRNTFYEGSFDPDNITNPRCFAIKASRDAESEMVPHENVTNPMNETCAGCPKAEWGTATRDGKPSRGKACKEGRRILVIPASVLTAEDPVQAVKAAEKAIIDLPVTSVANYSNFVNSVAATLNRPMWSIVTNVSLTRDMKTQFKIGFTPIETIDDPDVIRAIKGMLEDAERIVTIPYDETALTETAHAAPAMKTSKFTKK